jgi:hypothetical protein
MDRDASKPSVIVQLDRVHLDDPPPPPPERNRRTIVGVIALATVGALWIGGVAWGDADPPSDVADQPAVSSSLPNTSTSSVDPTPSLTEDYLVRRPTIPGDLTPARSSLVPIEGLTNLRDVVALDGDLFAITQFAIHRSTASAQDWTELPATLPDGELMALDTSDGFLLLAVKEPDNAAQQADTGRGGFRVSFWASPNGTQWFSVAEVPGNTADAFEGTGELVQVDVGPNGALITDIGPRTQTSLLSEFLGPALTTAEVDPLELCAAEERNGELQLMDCSGALRASVEIDQVGPVWSDTHAVQCAEQLIRLDQHSVGHSYLDYSTGDVVRLEPAVASLVRALTSAGFVVVHTTALPPVCDAGADPSITRIATTLWGGENSRDLELLELPPPARILAVSERHDGRLVLVGMDDVRQTTATPIPVRWSPQVSAYDDVPSVSLDGNSLMVPLDGGLRFESLIDDWQTVITFDDESIPPLRLIYADTRVAIVQTTTTGELLSIPMPPAR